MISELKELVDSYNAGVYTLEDTLNKILFLGSIYQIGDVILELPENWRSEFLSWARRKFDNDTPLDKFIIISQGRTSDSDLVPIARIREWFREQDSTAGQ